ncbi:hypothetical protein, partial [Pandoraea nosoerga]|uniref:hypothetical protein n=1 Tax=Pandoraea nosoerga TaxID=2508296 RepID=UPI0019821B17
MTTVLTQPGGIEATVEPMIAADTPIVTAAATAVLGGGVGLFGGGGPHEPGIRGGYRFHRSLVSSRLRPQGRQRWGVSGIALGRVLTG